MTKGFTLLELLIVMTLMGILAVIVFVAVNPAELMARSRDTGRLTAIAVLGRAVTAHYTTKNGIYPASDNWDQELIDTQGIAAFPKGLEYISNSVLPCQTNVRPAVLPTFCYGLDESALNGAIVFTKLESTKQVMRCTPPEVPYAVYSTVDGKEGILCLEEDPIPWAAGSVSYLE